MAELAIRSANEQDRVALEAMIETCYAASYRGWYGDELVRAAVPLMRKIETRLLHSGRYYLATLDDQIAGCGGWSAWKPGLGDEIAGLAHVRHFATRAGFMGRGIGSAILLRCVNEAGRFGFKRMECLSSFGAERFYAGHGFTRTGPVDINLPGNVVMGAVLMERPLS